jgi:hypothetical protein
MKIVILKCENCGIEFERSAAEAKRCSKKGFSIACSRSCGRSISNKKFPYKGPCDHLRNYTRLDQYSPFRYYIKKAKERALQYGQHNLTLEFLKDLWESQNEICPYTGKKMHLPASSLGHDKLANPNKASLDRIDSSKGYIQGNVEFVCLAVNYAKNRFSREDILEFFKINK